MSLIEMVVSIGLVGLVLVAALNSVGASKVAQSKMNNKLRGLQAAQELLNEILTKSYADPESGMGSFGFEAGERVGVRRDYDDIDDYDGLDESPPLDVDGAEITEFKEWTWRVKVHWIAPSDTTREVNYETGFKRIMVFALVDGMVQAEVIAVKSQGLPVLQACCQASKKCDELSASDCVARGGSPNAAGEHCWSIACGKSPIAHWKMDERVGTTAVDSVGDHDATLASSPIIDPDEVAWVSGHLNGAIWMNGTHASVAHADDLSITGKITISAWVYPTSKTGARYIVNKGTTSSDTNYHFELDKLAPRFGFHDGAAFRTYTAGYSVHVNRWCHMAVTFDDAANSAIFYVDGVQVDQLTVNLSPITSTQELYIGRSFSGNFWVGSIDDLRIYNSVLTAEEVAALAAESVSEVPMEAP